MKKIKSPLDQSWQYSATMELIDDLSFPPPKPEILRVYTLITRKINAYKFPALKASFDRRKKVYELTIEKYELSRLLSGYPVKITLLQFEITKIDPIEIHASYGKLPNQKAKYVIAPDKLDFWVNDIMAHVFTICL